MRDKKQLEAEVTRLEKEQTLYQEELKFTCSEYKQNRKNPDYYTPRE
ncbi:MAG: hypothetical protein ACOYKA_02255 [Legionellaceae bacterium]